MASEATGVSGVAGRYAAALYDLASQQGALDTVSADFASLSRMIGASADLKNLLKTRGVPRPAQSAAVAAVAERAELSPLVRNFLGVLGRNARLAAIPAIIGAYTKILAERRGEMTATVTVAQPMSDTQIGTLTETVKRAMGLKHVALDIWVDPTIIGGLILKIGSRRVDGSLRTKLHKMQLAMKGA